MATRRPFARRKPRYQEGSVYEKSGSFFVRYYIRDAKGKPRQVSKWLADKDANTGCTSTAASRY